MACLHVCNMLLVIKLAFFQRVLTNVHLNIVLQRLIYGFTGILTLYNVVAIQESKNFRQFQVSDSFSFFIVVFH